MARVPITVMGFRCERCGHEWVPRGGIEDEPRICPKCKSAYWNRPKKTMMTYDDFKAKISAVLEKCDKPLTWTEVRTLAGLPQLFPNNQWVHRMETDIGLVRLRESDGIIYWMLKDGALDIGTATPPETSNKISAGARAK
jgi:hypothetical protein